MSFLYASTDTFLLLLHIRPFCILSQICPLFFTPTDNLFLIVLYIHPFSILPQLRPLFTHPPTEYSLFLHRSILSVYLYFHVYIPPLHFCTSVLPCAATFQFFVYTSGDTFIRYNSTDPPLSFCSFFLRQQIRFRVDFCRSVFGQYSHG